MRRWEGCWEVSGAPWSEVELNLPRGGHYLIRVLPRGSDVAGAALLGALSQLPLPFLLKGGVELGTGPWGPLFWLQLCEVATLLLCSQGHFFFFLPRGSFAGLHGVPKMLL